jgi:hypothetical protein
VTVGPAFFGVEEVQVMEKGITMLSVLRFSFLETPNLYLIS